MDEDRMRAIARQEAQKFFEDAVFVRHEHMEQIVETTVKRVMQSFGIDIDNPIDVQENFVDLRSWSDLKRSISEGFIKTLSNSITMGIIALLVLGFYSWVTGHKPPSP